MAGCSPSSHIRDNRKLLKEYAYCKCLQYALADTIIFKEDISLAVYREIALYPWEVFDEIDIFSFEAAKNIKPSEIADHEGKKSVFLQCFRYYESLALDSMIKRMDKKIEPGFLKY